MEPWQRKPNSLVGSFHLSTSMPDLDNRPASTPTVSLILTTRNRMAELDNFLVYLDGQTFRDFEVLVVDQNSGPGVSELLARHAFPQQYFRSQQRGAARG